MHKLMLDHQDDSSEAHEMGESLDSIYQKMKEYSTEELRAIWNEGDGGQWTPSTLEIVSLILRDRGVAPGHSQGFVATTRAQSTELPPAVRAVDIRMPFSSMVVFMIKWMFASIPALILLSLLVVGTLVGLRAIGAPVPPLF